MNIKKRKIYTITQENKPFYNIVKPTDGMQITPDGHYVVTLTRDGSIWFWNCLTGSLERCFELEDENREVFFWRNLFYNKQKMVLTSDGSSVLVFNSMLNRLMVVDIENRTIKSSKIKSLYGESSIETMVISPDNNSFLLAMSNRLFIYRMKRYALVNDMAWENKSVNALAYNSKSYYFVAGFEDGDMVLYVHHPLKEVWSIEKAHKGAVNALLFTDNTEKIISAGEDGKVKVWDFHRGYMLIELYSSEQKITDLALSEDEQYLILTLEQSVVVLAMDSVEVVRIIEKESHSPHHPILTSVVNQKIAIQSTSSGLQLYDTDATQAPKEFTKLLYDNNSTHFSYMGCGYGLHYLLLPLDISFDSRYVVVNLSYQKIALWDMRKVELVGIYGEGDGYRVAVTLSADNRYIFSATYHEVDEDEKSFIEMYEVESSLLLYRFEIDIKYHKVVLLRVTPDNRYLIAILQGGTLMKWDIENLELVESRGIACHEYEIYAPTLSPDGSFLMYALDRSQSWSSDKVTSIEIVDLATGSRVESIKYTISTNSNALLTLDMSRDNRYVILYANNSKRFCWDREEKNFIPNSKIHIQQNYHDFSNDMVRSIVAPNRKYRVNIYNDEKRGLSVVGMPENRELYRLFVAEDRNALILDVEESEVMIDAEDEVLLRKSEEVKGKAFRRIEFEKYEGQLP